MSADFRSKRIFDAAFKADEVPLVLPPSEQQKRINLGKRANVSVVEIDVSTLYLAGNQTFNVAGYGLVFLRKYSNAGVLLDVDAGGVWGTFGPGDSLKGQFDSFTVSLNYQTCFYGKVYVLVVLTPDGWAAESAEASLNATLPTTLMNGAGVYNLGWGGYSGYNFATITEDVDPTALLIGATGTIQTSGWSRLRLILDTQSGGANATTFDLVPWVGFGNLASTAFWAEQGTERISIPDTDTSGQRYRVVTVPVIGRAGAMYFGVRNLQAAARTSIGIIAQGID